jgi:hypothetical protein
MTWPVALQGENQRIMKVGLATLLLCFSGLTLLMSAEACLRPFVFGASYTSCAIGFALTILLWRISLKL